MTLLEKGEINIMKKSIVIGLDIGTTSVKAVAFDRFGHVIGEKEVEYPLATPFPGWAEQDPAEIESATIMAIRFLLSFEAVSDGHILAVGISSAMHSLICIDEEGRPLTASITWADRRAAEQAENLKLIGENIYRATGTPLHPMSPLAKLIWMKETNFQPYFRAEKFVSIKEFLLYRWFGAELVDYSVAAATGLFDIHRLCWSEEALLMAGITKEKLFKPVPPNTILTGLNREIALQTGLDAHTPFVIGGSDGPLANLGIGAINSGEVAVTIGTSGAIRQFVSRPKIDESQQTFCYTFTDKLSLIGGPTNNGGIVLRWLRDHVSGGLDYSSMMALADTVPPGSDGLIFLPYLNGERAPLWDAHARGTIHGLSIHHKKEHIIRAGLESVILNLFQVGQTLEAVSGRPSKILASGGFARSPLWIQILADVFNEEVDIPISHQSSAWGAAWVALHAIGEVKDLISIKEHIPMQSQYKPNQENHQKYMETYARFKKLSEAISELS
jgi:gluconokinase